MTAPQSARKPPPPRRTPTPPPVAYTVTVTVTDANGLTATTTQPVTVTAAVTTPARYVNQIATNYSTSVHTSGYVTVWRSGGVAAGDLIIATLQLTGTTPTGTVTGTDAAGDTLTVVSDVADGNGNRLVVLSGIARTGLAVNDRITAAFPSATSYRLTADEVSGASDLDQQAAASGPAGPFSAGPTGTTSRPGEFVFAAVGCFGGTSTTWGTGWTGLTSYTVGTNALGRAYQIPSTTGSFTATGTCTGSWLASIATFR